MNILNSKAFGGAEYGTCVLGLVEIFEDDGKVSGTFTEDLFKNPEAAIGHELRQILNKFGAHGRNKKKSRINRDFKA
jgi:hypothetical protein